LEFELSFVASTVTSPNGLSGEKKGEQEENEMKKPLRNDRAGLFSFLSNRRKKL
jgi:hypothetical protein